MTWSLATVLLGVIENACNKSMDLHKELPGQNLKSCKSFYLVTNNKIQIESKKFSRQFLKPIKEAGFQSLRIKLFLFQSEQKILKVKKIILKDTCTPMFIAAVFTVVKTWQQPICSSRGEWIKKMWCIYTIYILLSLKKKNNAICSNMDINRDYTRWSKSERERQIQYDITDMQNLKGETDEPI